jgi:small conductance mechanosensitive channel
MQDMEKTLGSLESYAGLIASGLGFMLGAMLMVFLLYKLVSSVIKPRGKIARMVRVAFGAVYVLILLLAVVLAAENLGYDVSGIAGIAILITMVGAVIVFFAIPFLPRLPFLMGDLILVRGTLGVVESITTYQTVLRTFDGRLVFIPNMLLAGSDIQNYSTVPNRRVDLAVEVHSGDDIEVARQLMLGAMQDDARVLVEPAPSVFVTGLDKGIVTLAGFCWVINADWLATRDALIVDVVTRVNATDNVRLVQRELVVRNLG